MDKLFIRREGKPAHVTSSVAVGRIVTVFGGLATRKAEPLFRLELTKADGNLQYMNCHGTMLDVAQRFATLQEGYQLRYLPFTAVLNPLPNLRRESVQPSLLRVGRIEAIRPNTSNRKAKSIIARTSLPDLLVTEGVPALAEQLRLQGYSGAIDELGVYRLDAQFRDSVPPPAPKQKRVRVPDPFSPQARLDF
jgi:hypothetical protein